MTSKELKELGSGPIAATEITLEELLAEPLKGRYKRVHGQRAFKENCKGRILALIGTPGKLLIKVLLEKGQNL